MGAGFVIPNTFTAVNQVSPALSAMRKDVLGFAGAAEQTFNRMDRIVGKITPGLAGVQKQLLGLVGTGAALAGAFQLGNFSFNQLADYETAVDSFRVIVSDLNDTDFSKFQNEIDRVAQVSKRSGTEVAQAFEKIAGINATFAQTAEGLGQVSTASITLAKAARMDLGVAAENLVGIMNQFSFSAAEANRTINVLAAGQAIGAASITQTAEAFTVFGSVAAGSNVTLEQSVGLIQTLGKYSLFGAEAGTKLRGSILRLQKAGLGYASGQFNVNDALNQTNGLLGKLKTAKEKDMIINKLFGVENGTAGRILLNNVKTYQDFTKSVTGTSEAQKAAEINSGNLRTTIQQLGAAWVNYLTTSPKVASFMGVISDAAKWLANNLSTVVDVVMTAAKWFVIYKGTMLAARAVLFGYNVVLGINTAMMGVSIGVLEANTVAQRSAIIAKQAWTAATALATGEMATFSAALGLTPFGWALIAVGALAGAIYYLTSAQQALNAEYEKGLNIRIANSMSSEEKTLNTLIDRYTKLGMSIRDATASAIKFELANLNIQKIKIRAEVAALDKQIEGNKLDLSSVGLGKVGLLGTDALTSEALGKSQVLTGLEAQSLEVTNFAISKSKQEAPQIKPVIGEAEKFSGSELNNIFTAPDNSAYMQKHEITVKVENNTMGVVKVANGKSQAVSVQPGNGGSTKVLTR